MVEGMIVACVGLYDERVEQALVGIRRLIPFVDRYVVIADHSVTDEQIEQLEDVGCEVHVHAWEDSMPKMRNQYLSYITDGDWCIVHDPDEHFNKAFCNDVRQIVRDAERDRFGLLLINSHDISHDENGETHEVVSDFFKNLIFHKHPGTRYAGVGVEQTVHEMLFIPCQPRSRRLSKEYWYEHEKYWYEVWERATRNVFIGGGGNNRGRENRSWPRLRELCDELGVATWPKAREYFRKGNIDMRLKEWLWNNRFEGYDYQHEMMEFGRWYFEYLHPEEATFPDGRVWKPVTDREEESNPGIMGYVEECYINILGRHADQQGKEFYTKAIERGSISKEDLPRILRESREYKERCE